MVKKSPIWQYFTLKNDKTIAECRLCIKQNKLANEEEITFIKNKLLDRTIK